MSLKDFRRYSFLKSSDAPEAFTVKVFSHGQGQYGPYLKAEIVRIDNKPVTPEDLPEDWQKGVSLNISDDMIDVLMNRGIETLKQIEDHYLDLVKGKNGYIEISELKIAEDGGIIHPNAAPRPTKKKGE